eukprot:2938276-Pyramimonas_sp.AAC.1
MDAVGRKRTVIGRGRPLVKQGRVFFSPNSSTEQTHSGLTTCCSLCLLSGAASLQFREPRPARVVDILNLVGPTSHARGPSAHFVDAPRARERRP